MKNLNELFDQSCLFIKENPDITTDRIPWDMLCTWIAGKYVHASHNFRFRFSATIFLVALGFYKQRQRIPVDDIPGSGRASQNASEIHSTSDTDPETLLYLFNTFQRILISEKTTRMTSNVMPPVRVLDFGLYGNFECEKPIILSGTSPFELQFASFGKVDLCVRRCEEMHALSDIAKHLKKAGIITCY